MSGCTRTLQCTIRSRDGGEIQRTAEIKGEGKDYLKCLSESLSTMQSDVNALLTEMVDREKGQPANSNNARAEGSSDSEGMHNIVDTVKKNANDSI